MFADAVDGVEGDDGGSFAEAVAFEEGKAKFFVELLQCFVGQGSGAGDGEAEVEEPVDIEGDMRMDHGLKELGDADEDGGAGADDLLDGMVERLNRFDKDDAGTDGERGEDANGQHKAVKHGQQKREAVALGFVEDADATGDIGGEVGVGEHRALGFTGGAGGVDNDGKVVELRFDETGLGGGDLVEVGDVENADAFEFTADFEEVLAGDKGGELAVVGDVLDFRCLEEGVDGDGDSAGFQDGVENVDELGTVLNEDADAVAGTERGSGLEVGGETGDVSGNFAVPYAVVAPVDGDAARFGAGNGVKLGKNGLHDYQRADFCSAIICLSCQRVTRQADTLPPSRNSASRTWNTFQRRLVGT